MNAAEAQRHLTRIHVCGCQELWWMEPPGAIRCNLHMQHGGPCDDAIPPENRDEAMAVLRAADAIETERRKTVAPPEDLGEIPHDRRRDP